MCQAWDISELVKSRPPGHGVLALSTGDGLDEIDVVLLDGILRAVGDDGEPGEPLLPMRVYEYDLTGERYERMVVIVAPSPELAMAVLVDEVLEDDIADYEEDGPIDPNDPPFPMASYPALCSLFYWQYDA